MGVSNPLISPDNPTEVLVYTRRVDSASQYRNLAQLGRDEFLASAAPAALVRPRRGGGAEAIDEGTLTIEHSVDFDFLGGNDAADELEVYPLVKKANASFADRITIGRTSNNDLAFNEVSISRFHAYLRLDGDRWLVADAGSKNGTWVDGERLQPRRERAIGSKGVLRLGDVELTFYAARELYAALGGR